MRSTRTLTPPAALAGEHARDWIARNSGMSWVPVAHEGWPLGLLADQEGQGWRLLMVAGVLRLVPVDADDLRFELGRLAPRGVELKGAAADLPGLDVPSVHILSFGPKITPMQVNVGLATVALAIVPHAGRFRDEGRVLLVLDRARAVVPWVPA